jgi:hypothetical protein
MRRIFVEWPLLLARRSNNALRSVAAPFCALANRVASAEYADERDRVSSNEPDEAKQKSEFLKLMAGSGF